MFALLFIHWVALCCRRLDDDGRFAILLSIVAAFGRGTSRRARSCLCLSASAMPTAGVRLLAASTIFVSSALADVETRTVSGCRCQFPFTYRGTEWVTCTSSHASKHVQSGLSKALWCVVEDGCGQQERDGSFWYDQCINVLQFPPSPPPGSVHACCNADDSCKDVMEHKCGNAEAPDSSLDLCGMCASARKACHKWFFNAAAPGVPLLPCVWDPHANDGEGVCHIDARGRDACPVLPPPSQPSSPPALPHSSSSQPAIDLPARSPPAISPQPPASSSQAPAPPSRSTPPTSGLASSSSYAGPVAAAVTVGVAMALACWCGLRAVNRWAAGRASERLRDDNEGNISPSPSRSRTRASEIELNNSEFRDDDDAEVGRPERSDEKPSPARAVKSGSKKAKRGTSQDAVKWHDDEGSERSPLA